MNNNTGPKELAHFAPATPDEYNYKKTQTTPVISKTNSDTLAPPEPEIPKNNAYFKKLLACAKIHYRHLYFQIGS